MKKENVTEIILAIGPFIIFILLAGYIIVPEQNFDEDFHLIIYNDLDNPITLNITLFETGDDSTDTNVYDQTIELVAKSKLIIESFHIKPGQYVLNATFDSDMISHDIEVGRGFAGAEIHIGPNGFYISQRADK